jgi:HSP20 family protein
MTMLRWNPVRSLVSPSWDVDRFFSNFENELFNNDTTWRPAVDVNETKDAYLLNAELPGMTKEDIKISFDNNLLTLAGEKKLEHEENKENYFRVERAYGKFERSFRLPEGVNADQIKANYKNGVLSLEIPKSEKVKPKEIEIK